jgi:hypothetical protein
MQHKVTTKMENKEQFLHRAVSTDERKGCVFFYSMPSSVALGPDRVATKPTRSCPAGPQTP